MKPLRLVMNALGPYAGEQIIDFRQLGSRSFFLIHGPTGGGKTTILDAICYALYGDTSGHERTAEQMRSHLADPATATSVTFDFALGEKTYRVTRSPQQDRPRRRGEGVMTDAPKATLWNRTTAAYDSDEGLPLAAQPTRVTRTIEELLGFRSEQFRQVMVLPQGRFRELLIASSQQREEILRVLFGAEIYAKMQDALRQQAKAVQNELELLRIHQETMLRSAEAASVEELIARRDGWQTSLIEMKLGAEQLRAAKVDAAQALSKGEAAQARLDEHQQAAGALAQLEAKRPQTDQARNRLAAARRAATLELSQAIVAEKLREADARQGERTAAEESLRLAREKHQITFDHLQKQRASEGERESLRLELARLRGLAERVEAAEQAAGAAADAEQAAKRLTAGHATAKEKAEAIKVQLDRLQSQLSADRQIAAGHAGRQLELADAKRKESARSELDAALAGLRLAEKNRRDLVRRQTEADQAVVAARSELERLQRQAIAGQAAVLAAKLEPGAPCPVCGSTHHPSPAGGHEQIPTEDQLRAQQHSLAAAERKAADLRVKLSDVDQQSGRLQEKQYAAKALLGEFSVRSADEWRVEAQRFAAGVDESQAALDRAPKLEKKIGLLHEQLAVAVRDLEKLESERQSAADESVRRKAVRDGAFVDVPQSLATVAALAAATKSVESALKEMETALAQATAASSLTERVLAGAVERESKAIAEAGQSAAALEASRLAFADKRAAAGFADDAEFHAARLTDQAMRQIEAQVLDFDAALAAAVARADRAAEATCDLVRPDLAALRSGFTQAEQLLEDALRQQTLRQRELQQIESLIESLTQTNATLAELDRRFSLIGHIADVAQGRNPAGLTFQRFVLAFLLDDVLVAATHRLRLMSKGRYQLHRRRERDDQRVSSGLDLEVFDDYTGVARGVATLSGGESFLASLSLALGLADVVQARTGGIRLETIFIDEGFGSLDPESLDLAIRALTDLMKDGRLVGVISHVPELKEQISARLEISNDRRGSSAKFVLA